MTREEIMTEPAGRKMNAAIHEKVFGLKVNWQHGWPFTDEVGLLGYRSVPKYSEDIAAAWPVVEWLRERWGQISFYGAQAWRCNQYHYDPCHVGISGTGDTLPVAICRAALLVAMEEKR